MRRWLVLRWGVAATVVVMLAVVLHARAGKAADPAAPGGAADVSGEPPSGVALRAFDHFIVKGGWVTWCALIPLSIAALALGIQNALAIRRKLIIPTESVRRLGELIDQRQYAEAVRSAEGDPSMIAGIMRVGLVEAVHGYAAMERAAEEAVEERAAQLMRRIEYLNLIGNIAPMLGLFGTVTGIIGMFVSISESGGIPVVGKISADLGTALVATFWGLLIAIPTLAVFGILRNRIDVLTEECAITAARMLAVFRPRPVEAPRATAAIAPAVAMPGMAVAVPG